MAKCVICEQRPAKKDNGQCSVCADKIEAANNKRKPAQPVKFLTYRGHVVGLYPDGKGKLKGRLLKRKAENLPKSKTINLNIYCEGYSRAMIKSFKASVLMLANA